MSTQEQIFTEENAISAGYEKQTTYYYVAQLSTTSPAQTAMLWPLKPETHNEENEELNRFAGLRRMYLKGLKLLGYTCMKEYSPVITQHNAIEFYVHAPDKQLFPVPPKRAGEHVSMPEYAVVMIIQDKPHVIFCPRFGDFLEFQARYHDVIDRLER